MGDALESIRPAGLWDARYLRLTFDSAELLVYDDDPGHFVREHTGQIALPFGEEFDDVVKIGSFAAYYVDVIGAINRGVSTFDVFDTHSTTVGYYELYDADDYFRESVRKAAKAEYFFEPNLLILDRLEVLPPYRGFGYGLSAICGLIHWLQPGAGMVAMKPFPLQHEATSWRPGDPDPMGLRQFKGTFRSARAKLRRHYTQLGFRLVPKTDFMVRAGERPLPSPADD